MGDAVVGTLAVKVAVVWEELAAGLVEAGDEADVDKDNGADVVNGMLEIPEVEDDGIIVAVDTAGVKTVLVENEFEAAMAEVEVEVDSDKLDAVNDVLEIPEVEGEPVVDEASIAVVGTRGVEPMFIMDELSTGMLEVELASSKLADVKEADDVVDDEGNTAAVEPEVDEVGSEDANAVLGWDEVDAAGVENEVVQGKLNAADVETVEADDTVKLEVTAAVLEVVKAVVDLNGVEVAIVTGLLEEVEV